MVNSLPAKLPPPRQPVPALQRVRSAALHAILYDSLVSSGDGSASLKAFASHVHTFIIAFRVSAFLTKKCFLPSKVRTFAFGILLSVLQQKIFSPSVLVSFVGPLLPNFFGHGKIGVVSVRSGMSAISKESVVGFVSVVSVMSFMSVVSDMSDVSAMSDVCDVSNVSFVSGVSVVNVINFFLCREYGECHEWCE